MAKNDRERTEPAGPARPDPSESPPEAPEAPAIDATDEARPEADESELAEDDLQKLRAELEHAQDRALRIRAELENYRKRAARQMEEELRYASLPLIRDLLPVWDNIGRAIEAAGKGHDSAGLLEGFQMVAEQFENVLARHHCTKIDALGKPFDPNRHEAILQQPSDDHPANTVVHVAQTGFLLHDRVVRPSQVIVSAAPSAEDGAAEGAEEPTNDSDESTGESEP